MVRPHCLRQCHRALRPWQDDRARLDWPVAHRRDRINSELFVAIISIVRHRCAVGFLERQTRLFSTRRGLVGSVAVVPHRSRFTFHSFGLSQFAACCLLLCLLCSLLRVDARRRLCARLRRLCAESNDSCAVVAWQATDRSWCSILRMLESSSLAPSSSAYQTSPVSTTVSSFRLPTLPARSIDRDSIALVGCHRCQCSTFHSSTTSSVLATSIDCD